MHELPIVKEVLRIAVDYADENKAEKIVHIHIGVGELRDIVDIWMQKYFRFVSKGTIAQEAVLKVKRYPIICHCEECLEYFSLKLALEEVECPNCGEKNYKLVSGNEFLIEGIEVI